MSSSAFGTFRMDGMQEARAVLKTLAQEMQDKVLRTAIGRAAKPLVSTAKMFAGRSVRTGALRESIGATVKKGKGTTGSVFAVVGPMRGYFRGGKSIGKDGDARGADSPANYGHLVEFGHHVVAPIAGTRRKKKTSKAAKSGRTWVAAKPFMRPALLAAGDSIQTEMAAGVSEGITKQLKRLVKNPKAAR